MYRLRKIVALIPARGGSKGIPDKNIRLFHGKPLITWTIGVAQKCPIIDKIIVSTDSPKIAKIAKAYGADVPFLRPANLATDTANAIGVIMHTIDWLNKNSEFYDLILLLQPTSPLRTSRDIENSIKLLLRKKASAIVSVSEMEHSPLWANTLPQNGCMKNFIKSKFINMNRQKLPKYYRLNGSIFIADMDYFVKSKSFLGHKTYAYIMPQERSVDIDNLVDFTLAEILFNRGA